jgi:hypothetical protein
MPKSHLLWLTCTDDGVDNSTIDFLNGCEYIHFFVANISKITAVTTADYDVVPVIFIMLSCVKELVDEKSFIFRTGNAVHA